MKRLLPLLACVAATAPALVSAAPAAAPAQAARDWSQSVVATPEGGIRMGNPDAPLKVVEFVSLTCGHCGDFAANGMPALVRDHVRSGRVNFELRPFPLDFVAATAAQLGSCVAPERAFAFNHEVLTTQEQWIARLDALTPEQISQLEAAPPPQQRQRVAENLGLVAIAGKHGLTAPAAQSCLADDAAAQRIVSIKISGEQLGVDATPSFALNGRLASNVHDWTALEPLLKGR